MFIGRSGNCGLSIRVDGGTTTDYDIRGREEWVFGMDGLMAVQCRWEQVSIRTRPTIWAHGFVQGRNWCIS